MTGRAGLPYERIYRVRYHDCGPDLRLAAPTALRYAEEIALLQSEDLGVGFDFYRDKSVAWVLSQWDLSFGEMPGLDERVTARTLPTVYKGITAERRFSVRRDDGAFAVEGTSRWTFLDTARMRPARVPTELAEVYRMPPPSGPLPPLADPEPPDAAEIVAELTVRADDIDVNGHVNNVRYVEWALESVRDGIPAGLRLRGLRARYRRQALVGATLRVAASLAEEGERLRGRHVVEEAGEAASVLETVWG